MNQRSDDPVATYLRRVEILDRYHAKEHVSAAARILYGEETERSAQWRQEQLDRLWDDRVEEVIAGLRFLGAHQRSAVKRKAVEDLHRYLSTHRERMRYRTLREAGLPDRQRGGRERHRPCRPAAHEAGGDAVGGAGSRRHAGAPFRVPEHRGLGHLLAARAA